MDAALRGEPVDFSSISSVVEVGPSRSKCGYCHKKDSSITYGLWAYTLSCQDYQLLIDRGWRRSGKYLYKPNLAGSCCSQYTIRLEVSKFIFTKSYKQVVSKFNRFVSFGDGGQRDRKDKERVETEKLDTTVTKSTTTNRKRKEKEPVAGDGTNRKGRGNVQTKVAQSKHQAVSIPIEVSRAAKGVPETIRHVVEIVHAVDDRADVSVSHRFRTVLLPASYDEETFKLYCKYQMAVHSDPASKLTEKNFCSFLVHSPLLSVPPESPSTPLCIGASKTAIGLGSYHQRYYMDDKIIACAVLDILPKCVSSVYFFYDPDFSSLALGKYSAIREIALTAELGRYYPELRYYYLGYYIHTCPKMKYKAVNNRPSDLLDPETYDWVPFSQCEPLLNERNGGFVAFQKELRRRASQSSPSNSTTALPGAQQELPKEKPKTDVESKTANKVASTESVSSTGSSSTSTVSEGQGMSDWEEGEDDEEEDGEAQSLDEMDPMPGTAHPESVTVKDLADVFVVDGNAVVQSIACKRLIKSPAAHRRLQRYYATVGKELARRMLVEFY